MRASASMMQEMFRGMQFPMRKDQILEHARRQKASSDIIEGLQMLPDREYESADSVMQAMEATSQTVGGGGGGKSQSFGGTGTGGSGGSGGGGGSSSGGSSQGFGGRGGE
ncbi:MAG: DUF2795 domain-containing protein [Methanosarcina sp.]